MKYEKLDAHIVDFIREKPGSVPYSSDALKVLAFDTLGVPVDFASDAAVNLLERRMQALRTSKRIAFERPWSCAPKQWVVVL